MDKILVALAQSAPKMSAALFEERTMQLVKSLTFVHCGTLEDWSAVADAAALFPTKLGSAILGRILVLNMECAHTFACSNSAVLRLLCTLDWLPMSDRPQLVVSFCRSLDATEDFEAISAAADWAGARDPAQGLIFLHFIYWTIAQDQRACFGLIPIVSLIPTSLVYEAIPKLLESQLDGIVSALQLLSLWPLSSTLAVWISALLDGIRNANRADLFADASTTIALNIASQLRQAPDAAMDVLEKLLYGLQHDSSCWEAVSSLFLDIISHDRGPCERILETAHIMAYLHPDCGVLDMRPLFRGRKMPSDFEITQILKLHEWSSGAPGSVLRHVPNTGLVNLGNTCFANAWIQAMGCSDNFVASIVERPPRTPMGLSLSTAVAFLRFSGRVTYSPENVISLLDPEAFAPGLQHDTLEFGNVAFDALEPHASRHFGFSQTMTRTCDECRRESVKEEPLLTLGLGLSPGETIQAHIEQCMQPERLENDNEYFCDGCSKLCEATQHIRLTNMPTHLILNLHRFEFGRHGRVKLTDCVMLDSTLAVENTQYILYAVIFHSGVSAEGGHYYTAGRRTGSTQWMLLNDNVCTPTTLDSVLDLHATHPAETPYVLFYHRHDIEPVKNYRIAALLRSKLEEESQDAYSSRGRRLTSTTTTASPKRPRTTFDHNPIC